MTPQDWNVALRPEVPNAEAHKFIATIVRAHLEHNILLDDMVSTTTLVDTIYPAALAKQSDVGKAARDRIFNALRKEYLAGHELKDCVTPGIKQKIGIAKRLGTPLLWHAPRKVKCCEACGQPLP